MKEFTVQEVKDMITPLAKSQGSYSRMVSQLNKSKSGWEKLTKEINKQGLKDVVDIILYLEG